MNSTLKYGLFAGLLMAGLAIGAHYVNLELSQGMGFTSIVSFLIPIIFMVLGVKAERDFQEGLISFGEALKTAFFVFMIGAIISTVLNFVHMNTYNDATWEKITEIQLANASGMMEMFGGSDATITEAMEEQMNAEAIKEQSTSPGILVIGLIMSAVFGIIISLIVAAIMKKNPTP